MQSLELRAVAHKVYSVLTDLPETRDDDRKLLIAIWASETNADDLKSFFKEILCGHLSHFESIRRVRQRIQEKYPTLRGKKWSIRHKMQGCIQQQLKLFDNW